MYQLLASPYQDLWLHWLDEGNDAYKQQAKDSNQERLDFVRSVVAAAAATAGAAAQNGTTKHEGLQANGVEAAHQVRSASHAAVKSEPVVMRTALCFAQSACCECSPASGDACVWCARQLACSKTWKDLVAASPEAGKTERRKQMQRLLCIGRQCESCAYRCYRMCVLSVGSAPT